MFIFYCFCFKTYDLNFGKKIKSFFFNLEKFFNKQGKLLCNFALPRKISKITVLKSPHIFSKAKETFEQNIYKEIFFFIIDIKSFWKFHSIICSIGWSLFGVSCKKTKIEKVCIFF